MKTVINPPEMAAPTGYSYAIKKSGTPVFIAGQGLGLFVYVRNLYFIALNGRQASS